MSVDSPIDSWILDLGASFHTTAHCEIIENYIISNFNKVYMANRELLEIIGMGNIHLKISNGSV